MSSSESAAVTDLGRGVIALALPEQVHGIARERLAEDVGRIDQGETDAIVYTSGPSDRRVLVSPSKLVLMRQDTCKQFDDTLLDDIAGKSLFQDSTTALMNAQWRLWLFGQQVLTAEGPLPDDWETSTPAARALRIRGLLLMLQTNLAQPLRGRILTLAELLTTSSALHASASDTAVLDLQRSPGGDDVGTVQVPVEGLVGAFAMDQTVAALSPSRTARERIDRGRRVPDRALLPLIQDALSTILPQIGGSPGEINSLTEILGIDRDFDHQVRVLIVAPDQGEGNERASALASKLDGLAHVRRDSTQADGAADEGHEASGRRYEQVQWADVVVLVSATLDDVPGARFASASVVADLSARDVAGWLMKGPRTRYRSDALRDLMARADLVIAADDIQRDILLGALAGTERVNADVYDDDPSLTSLVTTDHDLDIETAFCLHPVRAADFARTDDPGEVPRPSLLQMVRTTFREGGVREVAARALGRIRKAVPSPSTGKEN